MSSVASSSTEEVRRDTTGFVQAKEFAKITNKYERTKYNKLAEVKTGLSFTCFYFHSLLERLLTNKNSS